MNLALIVVTTHVSTSGRVYDGGDEWCDGWKFLDKPFALRKRGDGKIEYPDDLDDVARQVRGEDAIIWVRGTEQNAFPSAQVNRLIGELATDHEVYLAHHDSYVRNAIDADQRQKLKRFSNYTMSQGANPDGFAEILTVSRRGRKHLDYLAKFDSIFESFFLDPTDVFVYVKHKLTGLLSIIDIDLQGLWDSEFAGSHWESLVEAYRPRADGEGMGSRKLKLCKSLLYEDTISLKKLYEKEKVGVPEARQADLTQQWDRLNELLPPDDGQHGEQSVKVDKLYLTVSNIIAGLEAGNEAKVRKYFNRSNVFRQWVEKLNGAIDGIREVVTQEQSNTVGA